MKRIKLLIISALICVLSNAQTLQQGRNYFLQGDYEKAKPIMLKYLKQKPDDASRNYWYGICCMETGEKDKAIPYLEKAAAKKIEELTYENMARVKDIKDYNACVLDLIAGKSPCLWCEEHRLGECEHPESHMNAGCHEWWLRYPDEIVTKGGESDGEGTEAGDPVLGLEEQG